MVTHIFVDVLGGMKLFGKEKNQSDLNFVNGGGANPFLQKKSSNN